MATEPQGSGARIGDEAEKLARMVATLLCGFMPARNDAPTTETQALIASVLKPIIEKHGWTVAGLPAEIRLLLETGPVLLQSGRVLSQQAVSTPAASGGAPSNGEEIRGVDGRRRSDRRSDSVDRRRAQAQNIVRPFRWNQFKP